MKGFLPARTIGPRRLMSRKEASHYLGVSLSKLDKDRLTGNGAVFLKIGAKVLYDQADLEAYLESCRCRSTSE